MSMPRHSLSAGAVVLNDKGELLLIKGPRRGWEFSELGNNKKEHQIDLQFNAQFKQPFTCFYLKTDYF